MPKNYTKEETEGHWITVKGRHILLKEGESVEEAFARSDKAMGKETSPELTDSEIEAVHYWKGGASHGAAGYKGIRAVANGYPTEDENAKRLTEDFIKAVHKAPSAEGDTLIRVTGGFVIPNHGKPKVGMEFNIGKLESFSKTPEKNYDTLIENLGVGDSEELVYRIKGTSNFKDISNLGHHIPGTAVEKEVITLNAGKYRITKVTPIKTEPTWLNPEGKQKYIMVDLEPVEEKKGR